MTKTNIGLGILSIPFIFQAIGLVPGVLVIIVIQVRTTDPIGFRLFGG